ncbi:hypothetical protein F5B20DRAFT_541917 [Whalleya microplaca]|nr:hypothetical protein F5B20DRAFT_541917 [Whalleya microplaca]
MPRPLSSSVSVKTESPLIDAEKENESEPELELEQEFEPDPDIVFVASDLVQSAPQSTRPHNTREPLPSGGEPRCEICKKQHQKCTFLNPSGKCDKCFKQCYECRIVDVVRRHTYHRRPKNVKPETAKRQPTNHRGLKCDWCYSNNKTCLPAKRIWPAKCKGCMQRGLPCSPPQLPGTYFISQKSDEPPNHTEGLLVPMSSDSDASESSDTDSNMSIPAVLPNRKRKRAESSGAPRNEVAELKSTIVQMEHEYEETVRSLQARHEQELTALRAKCDLVVDQLMNATRNHDRRVDDLILIMKSNQQRADEVIQSLKNK